MSGRRDKVTYKMHIELQDGAQELPGLCLKRHPPEMGGYAPFPDLLEMGEGQQGRLYREQ